MRIFQHTATLALNDAVSDDIVSIYKILKQAGYKTRIYAERGIENYREFADYDSKLSPNDNDITIFHVSISADIYDRVTKVKGKKVILYHNITPPKYMIDHSPLIFEAVKTGREQLKKMINVFDYALADSQYNADELVNEFRYKKEVEVLPIIYDFKKLNSKDNTELKKQIDKRYNIIFVGRVAPNKCHDDIIKAYYFYRKYFEKNSRLYLIGSFEGMEHYKSMLDSLITKLNLNNNVFFTGKVNEQDKHTFYRNSSLYLSMSEHEGFCVPALECMHFNLPVLAYYNSGALPDTLGTGGIYFTKKKFFEIASIMNYMIKKKSLKEKIVNNQKKELKKFEYNAIKTQFLNFISRITK